MRIVGERKEMSNENWRDLRGMQYMYEKDESTRKASGTQGTTAFPYNVQVVAINVHSQGKPLKDNLGNTLKFLFTRGVS